MNPNEFNFMVDNKNLLEGDKSLFFNDESVEIIDESTTLYNLLIKCNIFPSKNQCRKNWKKTPDDRIPRGFSDFTRIGKLRKRITILNPIAEDESL